MGWFGYLTLFLYLVYTPHEMCKVEVTFGCLTTGLDTATECTILGILLDNNFRVGSVHYEVVVINLDTDGKLKFYVNGTDFAGLQSVETLHVDGRRFRFADATEMVGNAGITL